MITILTGNNPCHGPERIRGVCPVNGAISSRRGGLHGMCDACLVVWEKNSKHWCPCGGTAVDAERSNRCAECEALDQSNRRAFDAKVCGCGKPGAVVCGYMGDDDRWYFCDFWRCVECDFETRPYVVKQAELLDELRATLRDTAKRLKTTQRQLTTEMWERFPIEWPTWPSFRIPTTFTAIARHCDLDQLRAMSAWLRSKAGAP